MAHEPRAQLIAPPQSWIAGLGMKTLPLHVWQIPVSEQWGQGVTVRVPVSSSPAPTLTRRTARPWRHEVEFERAEPISGVLARDIVGPRRPGFFGLTDEEHEHLERALAVAET